MGVNLPGGRNRDEWQGWAWNLADDFICRPQKLQFMLMLGSPFNTFDPFRVVGDLLRNRPLWEGAIMDHAYPMAPEERSIPTLWTDLIKLRDIGRGVWDVDTLFVRTSATPEEWAPVVDDWMAEVYFTEGQEAVDLLRAGKVFKPTRILTAWWDRRLPAP